MARWQSHQQPDEPVGSTQPGSTPAQGTPPTTPRHPRRWRLVGVAALGGAMLLAALLVYPRATLAEQTAQALDAAATAQAALERQRRDLAAAEQARDAALAEEEAARDAQQALRAQASALTEAQQAAQDAEETVLQAIADTFDAANGVIEAQNAAVGRGNAADPAGEARVITEQAIPASAEYARRVAQARTAVDDAGPRVDALVEKLP